MLLFSTNRFIVVCIFMCLFSFAHSQGFDDVGIELQIEGTSDGADYGCGVSFYDFNHDGWDDITFGLVNGKVQLFKNVGGTFEFISIGLPQEGDVNAVTWLDFDNDGDSDLFYLVNNDEPKLYENTGDFEFIDITEGAGFDVSEVQSSYGAAWGDYDRDGYLDLYVSNYNAFFTEYTTNHLYKNNGDGTFTDVTEESGTGNENKYTFVSIWMDYDEDGWIDLYVGNDRDWHVNEMYKNNGDGTFTAVGEEIGLNINIHNMTHSITDYDHDGDLDVYNTGTCGTNQLMQNNSGVFEDVTEETGTAMTDTSWGANWIDFDNDMDEDIYSPTTNCALGDTPNHFYIHNEDHTFTAADDLIDNSMYRQLTSCMGDFNNDGRMDLVAPNEDWIFASVLENQEVNDNHYLKVSLEGTVSNRDGISSWIELYTDTITQTRYTFCGEDFMGQDSQREHFGMAAFEMADSLVVRWLSGHIDVFYDISADQTLHIVEGSSMTPTLSGFDFCLGTSSTISVLEDYDSLVWNTEEFTNEIIVTEPGIYSVIAFNELGIPSNEVSIQIDSFEPISINENVIHPSCYGMNNGSITLESSSEIVIESVAWAEGFEGSALENIEAGIYAFTVLDGNGCLTQDSVEVFEPEELIVNFEIDSILCSSNCTGSISLDISGGTSEYEILGEVVDLCSGTHSITVQDAQLCVVNLVVEIVEPEPISIETTLISVSCFGLCDGAINAVVTGGTAGYEILGDTAKLCAGEHSINVVDINNCAVESVFEILEPEALNLIVETTPSGDEVLGTANLTIEGGTPPFEIEWSNGEEGLSISDLSIDEYWVEVVDANNCSFQLDFNIVVGVPEHLFTRLSIYPSPATDQITVKGMELNSSSFYEVFDSSGRILLTGTLQNPMIPVSELAAGVYILKIKSGNQTRQLPFLIATP